MVQQWALHALASIGEASGPVFRPFADSCSNMALQLLMTVPATNVEVLRAVGRCCAALVTAFGPELQGIREQLTYIIMDNKLNVRTYRKYWQHHRS